VSESVRLTIRFPKVVAAYVDEVAERRGLDRPAVIRRALGIMQAFDMEAQGGRYVGATSDREALETVIVAPL
jgi:hypothetical protein